MVYKIHVDEIEFRNDYRKGMTLDDMAKKYGFSTHTSVYNRARNMGLPLRGQKKVVPPVTKKHALTGGKWVSNGRIQVWVPN